MKPNNLRKQFDNETGKGAEIPSHKYEPRIFTLMYVEWLEKQLELKWILIKEKLPPANKYVLLVTHAGEIVHEFIHEYDLTTNRFTKNYTHWTHEPKAPNNN